MITSKLVVPGYIGEPENTGCKSFEEAARCLKEHWNKISFQCSNVLVLADTDGTRLILQKSAA